MKSCRPVEIESSPTFDCGPVAFTVGHSTRSFDEFAELLKAHKISLLVDVRSFPRSRSNPQFNTDQLPRSLAAQGVEYKHVDGLGGFRRARPDSKNDGWRNKSFRGYADYMETETFSACLEWLLGAIKEHRLALMCAEAVPWRCHRSLIADALLVRGVTVREISSATKSQPHKMTPFAHVDRCSISYPAYEE